MEEKIKVSEEITAGIIKTAKSAIENYSLSENLNRSVSNAAHFFEKLVRARTSFTREETAHLACALTPAAKDPICDSVRVAKAAIENYLSNHFDADAEEIINNAQLGKYTREGLELELELEDEQDVLTAVIVRQLIAKISSEIKDRLTSEIKAEADKSHFGISNEMLIATRSTHNGHTYCFAGRASIERYIIRSFVDSSCMEIEFFTAAAIEDFMGNL